MSLRDALLASLTSLPGTREFHLHVLVSSPRKHSALFPFARPRPRTYLQNILILLSEQATPDSPRILVTGIEASLYNLPATSCAILYVSKVDSTGQSISPSPTQTLVRSLLKFYGDPSTRPVSAAHLWVHLFARAQGQYLFPNSAEYSGKHPLSDVKLCAWWKRVLTDVAEELDTATVSKARIKLSFILPGYGEFEARNLLKCTSTSTQHWTYGHPYSQTEIPLPCPLDSDVKGVQNNLGCFIPSFDDDPKSRFMEEIAYTTEADGVKSPERKRPRTISGDKTAADAAAEKEVKDERPLGDLGKVTPDEFWERMSFRQECIAGAVTGFFNMAVSLPACEQPALSPLAPQLGQVSSHINKRIMTTLLTSVEFSTVEYSIRATEVLEGAIQGSCAGLAVSTTTPALTPTPTGPNWPFLTVCVPERRTPEPEPDPLASYVAPPSTPPPRRRPMPEISPNPFPEPVTSLETYHSHVYGSICVSNAAVSKAVDVKGGSGNEDLIPQVTVLKARKKKRMG